MAADGDLAWWKKLAILDFKLRVVVFVVGVVVIGGALLYTQVIVPATCERTVSHVSGDGPAVTAFSTSGSAYNTYTRETVGGLLTIHTDQPVSRIRVTTTAGDVVAERTVDDPSGSVLVDAIKRDTGCSTFRVTVTAEGASSTYEITGQIDRYSMMADALED